MGTGQNFLGLAIRCLSGLTFDVAHHFGSFMARAGLNFFEKSSFRFFRRQAGNFLKTPLLFDQLSGKFFSLFFKLAFLPCLIAFLKQQILFFLGESLHFFFHALTHILKLFFAAFQLPLLLLILVFQFPLLVEQFILALNEYFFFLGLGFLTRFLDDTTRQIVGVALCVWYSCDAE